MVTIKSPHSKSVDPTQNHQTFCMRLVLVSLIYSYMSIIIETLHDQSFSFTSEDIASKTPNHQLLGTRGPRDSHDVSVYETCACVIHTINLLSYMCINAIIVIHINVCAGYMCFVKL